MTLQVVDERAIRGITVHPADKTNQIRVSEVMGERRTADKICSERTHSSEDVGCSKRMDISGGVDSAADLVDQGLISTPVRSSFKFFPRAHFLNRRNMPPAADVENRYQIR